MTEMLDEIATTGPRSAGPRYGYRRLRELEEGLGPGERVVFLNAATEEERLKARKVFAAARRLTGAEADAVAGYDPVDRVFYVAFRNRNGGRAAAMEEIYHLSQWRNETWRQVLPDLGINDPFLARELDAAVYLRNQFRSGNLNQTEYHETVANLHHHLRNGGVTGADSVEAVRQFLDALP
jgi:hypothetical protein